MTTPKIFILSAPSGTGKNTVVSELLKSDIPIRWVRTMTSRKRRPNDRPDEYHYVSEADFRTAITNNEMLEWVEFNGNLYGTRRQDVEDCIAAGFSPVLVIDVRGSAFFKQEFPDSVSIFLKPDSLEVVRHRLEARGMTESDIEDRLNIAKHELALMGQFDHVVVNHDGRLADTVSEMAGIIRGELAK